MLKKTKSCEKCDYINQDLTCGHVDQYNFETIKKDFFQHLNSKDANLNKDQQRCFNMFIAAKCSYYVNTIALNPK